jgi:hypothetical protein
LANSPNNGDLCNKIEVLTIKHGDLIKQPGGMIGISRVIFHMLNHTTWWFNTWAITGCAETKNDIISD